MSEAKAGNTVKVHYKGTLDDGTVFDSSHGRDPLEFTVGSGMVIPGFDNAVDGLAVGDSKTVTIPPDQAYGEVNKDLVIDVAREQIPSDITPEIGMGLHMQSEDGQGFDVTVTAVSEESVTLDGNHPLAGKTLTFEVELVEIVA